MSAIYDNDPDRMLGVPDEEVDRRFAAMIRLAKEEARIKGLPTAEYDKQSKKAYLLYPDGRKEYINV